MSYSEDRPRRIRIVLCMGAFCNISGRTKPLYRELEAAVSAMNDGDMFAGPLKLEVANCLSMCGVGPNLMLYPQARAVNDLDTEKLVQVLAELRAILQQ